MEIKELSENLKYHRYRLGFTQEELSACSGVALATVKKIEGGHSAVRPKTVDALAVALKITIEELSVPPKRLRSIRFRTCRKMRSKEGIVALIINKLARYNQLEEAAGAFLERKYMLLPSSASPAQHARRCRELLGYNQFAPIADISYDAARLGFKLFSIDVNTEKFFSLSVGEEDGGPAIIVNSNKKISFEQAVFSIAHEIGHFAMHRGFKREITDEMVWAEEDEADLFASHFLMPDEGFHTHWNANTGLPFCDRVVKVKQIYGVNHKMVFRRLGDYEELIKRFEREYEEEITKGRDPAPLNKLLSVEQRFLALEKKASAL